MNGLDITGKIPSRENANLWTRKFLNIAKFPSEAVLVRHAKSKIFVDKLEKCESRSLIRVNPVLIFGKAICDNFDWVVLVRRTRLVSPGISRSSLKFVNDRRRSTFNVSTGFEREIKKSLTRIYFFYYADFVIQINDIAGSLFPRWYSLI